MEVFTQGLGHRFQTLAPDLRGYGRSRTRQDFSLADHLRDLEELLDRQNIGPYWILGWSLGGILALEMAMRHPDRVQGLILIATAARPRSNHPPTVWQDDLYTAIASLINVLIPGWGWNIRSFGQKSLYRYLLETHTPATYRYLARYALGAYLRTSPQAHRALRQALGQRYDRTADLPRILCPCWVAAGENDRHITAAASEETARLLPQATWQLYPHTAHLFPWEIPHQMLQDIEAWLQGLASPSP